jgi:p-aminobenzoyl-glutamate transporter AbgT
MFDAETIVAFHLRIAADGEIVLPKTVQSEVINQIIIRSNKMETEKNYMPLIGGIVVGLFFSTLIFGIIYAVSQSKNKKKLKELEEAHAQEVQKISEWATEKVKFEVAKIKSEILVANIDKSE